MAAERAKQFNSQKHLGQYRRVDLIVSLVCLCRLWGFECSIIGYIDLCCCMLVTPHLILQFCIVFVPIVSSSILLTVLIARRSQSGSIVKIQGLVHGISRYDYFFKSHSLSLRQPNSHIFSLCFA